MDEYTASDSSRVGAQARSTGIPDSPEVGPDRAGSAGPTLKDGVRQTARSVTDDLKRAGLTKANEGLEAAAETTRRLADSVSEAATGFTAREQPIMGRLAGEAAEALEHVSQRLRTSDVDHLVGEVRSLARTNPALFTLGAVALGFALSRFFKAGGPGEAVSTRPSANDGRVHP